MVSQNGSLGISLLNLFQIDDSKNEMLFWTKLLFSQAIYDLGLYVFLGVETVHLFYT